MVLNISGIVFYPIFVCEVPQMIGLKTLAKTFGVELVEDEDGNLTFSEETKDNKQSVNKFLTFLKNSDSWSVDTFKVEGDEIPTMAFVHKEFMRNAQRS